MRLLVQRRNPVPELLLAMIDSRSLPPNLARAHARPATLRSPGAAAGGAVVTAPANLLRHTPGLHCDRCARIPIFDSDKPCSCGGTFRMVEGPIAKPPDEYSPDRLLSDPEPQYPVRHEPLAAQGREGEDAARPPGRVRVAVTSYRRRLIDPDNLCPKFAIDACRYAGLIRDDSEADIEFSVRQEKVATKAEEKTVIELTNQDEPPV